MPEASSLSSVAYNELVAQIQIGAYVLGGFVVVVSILGLIYYIQRSRKASRLDTIAQLDLTARSTSLTPEEKAKIRAAQARLIQQTHLSEQKKTALSPSTLLADPLVAQLKERAALKQRGLDDKIPPVPAGTDSSAESEPLPASSFPMSDAGNEVELPPDVLKMAELGLITEEELATIRQRIQQKKSSLG
jgi:hypothetical protein